MRGLHLALSTAIAFGCAAKESKLIDGHTMSFPSAEREPRRAPIGGTAPWDPQPEWSPVHPSPKVGLAGPTRPSVVGTFTFDYAALEVQRVRDEPPFVMSFTGSDFGLADVPSLPFVAALTADGQTHFVSGISAIPTVRANLCPGHIPIRPVVMQGFRKEEWQEDALDFVQMDGSLRSSLCQASLHETTRVRARAVVPGILYAFRGPARVSKASTEELVVIGPRAQWISTSADPKLQGKDPVGLFSVVSVPLERGKSASVLMQVRVKDIETFHSAQGTKLGWKFPSAHVLVFSIDVVWPESAPAPEGYGSIAQWIEPRDEF